MRCPHETERPNNTIACGISSLTVSKAVCERCKQYWDGSPPVRWEDSAPLVEIKRLFSNIKPACDDEDTPSRGLGDTIAKFTAATGIDKVVHAVVGDCGCKQRQEALNKLVPYQENQ